MMRTRTKIGDIFCVKLENNTKRYFQFIAIDQQQLGSDVVRVFKKSYSQENQPEIEKIIEDEIEFCTHVIIKFGLKLKLWEKVGYEPNIGNLDIMFRSSLDFGNRSVIKSERWEVWKINQSSLFVGKLNEKYRNLELGLVVSPEHFVDRLKTGYNNIIYPDC
jgi:hypothetical protein